MTNPFKVYLGTIEVPIDGILYEVGLREEGAGALRGIWTCTDCEATDVASELRPTTTEAIDFAKRELQKHHEEVHQRK